MMNITNNFDIENYSDLNIINNFDIENYSDSIDNNDLKDITGRNAITVFKEKNKFLGKVFVNEKYKTFPLDTLVKELSAKHMPIHMTIFNSRHEHKIIIEQSLIETITNNCDEKSKSLIIFDTDNHIELSKEDLETISTIKDSHPSEAVKMFLGSHIENIKPKDAQFQKEMNALLSTFTKTIKITEDPKMTEEEKKAEFKKIRQEASNMLNEEHHLNNAFNSEQFSIKVMTQENEKIFPINEIMNDSFISKFYNRTTIIILLILSIISLKTIYDFILYLYKKLTEEDSIKDIIIDLPQEDIIIDLPQEDIIIDLAKDQYTENISEISLDNNKNNDLKEDINIAKEIDDSTINTKDLE